METNYKDFTDEQLVLLAKDDNGHAITEIVFRYLPMIRYMASKYGLPGMESDDIIQEGFLGLMKAVKLYHSEKSSFKTFSKICIDSSMLTAARSALSQKNSPLSNYTSIDDSEVAMVDYISLDPEQSVLAQEQIDGIMAKIATALTPLEQQTLKLYLAGHSYFEISKLLSTTSKAVDNALQRVRRKLQSVI